MSTIAAALNVLLVDCKCLEDAKRDCKKQTMFIADVEVSKALQNYKRKLEDLEQEIERPILAFEKNEMLADLVAGIKTFGSLKTQHILHRQGIKLPEKSLSTSSTKVLIDRKITSRSVVNVRTDDDKYDPWISGCTVMPTGHVVLCDQSNKKVKLLNDSWTITGRLDLPDPLDVSVIDSSNVIVSSPNKKQLQNVQVFPKMKAGRTIQLYRRFWGVTVSGQEIYTTCQNNPGLGEVKVLDMQGKLKRRLGTYLFTSPNCITVSASGEKIFVSDEATHIITCLKPSGTIIYTYKDDNMRSPGGLICDSGDNVLVCGYDSNNVHAISPNGNKNHTFITSKDGLSKPSSIAYKENDDTLIVGCHDRNELLLFKLV